MASYLIEIPHSESTTECQNVIRLFVESGSHLLANAYWGCLAGVHKSWFVGSFDSKDQAVQIIPPFLRHSATVIELTQFDKMDLARFGGHNAP